jgi:hypothetical protein
VHLTDHIVRMISNMKLGKEKSIGSYRCFLVAIPSRFQPKSNTAHIQKKVGKHPTTYLPSPPYNVFIAHIDFVPLLGWHPTSIVQSASVVPATLLSFLLQCYPCPADKQVPN